MKASTDNLRFIVGQGVLGSVDLELTERNLRTLLLKLEREDSARTLEIWDGAGRVLFRVKAVPDSEHYADREPGEVHPIEADKLTTRDHLDEMVRLSEEMGLYDDELT